METRSMDSERGNWTTHHLRAEEALGPVFGELKLSPVKVKKVVR